jgi:hypothetical protein
VDIDTVARDRIVNAWPVGTVGEEAGHVYGVEYASGGFGWVRWAQVPPGFRTLKCSPQGCAQCGK